MYWYGRDGRTDSRRDAGATLNGVATEKMGFVKEILETACSLAKRCNRGWDKHGGLICVAKMVSP
jgi:hypothetical protein